MRLGIFGPAGRFLMRFTAFLGALALSACSYQSLPTYRYRMTVEVETPEGLRTGSTIIEVRSNFQRTPISNGGVTRVIGEAATIDLGKRGRLYALLRSDVDEDWAGTLYSYLTPFYPGTTDVKAAEARAANRGPIVVPRQMKPQWAASADSPRPLYPMLVHFENRFDPKSVRRDDPDHLEATMGKGVKLRRIVVEITDDKPSFSIDRDLPWVSNLPGYLSGKSVRSGSPDIIANSLHRGNFIRRK